jgi:hypothetical protein
LKEFLGLLFAVSHHPLNERWVAIKLRFGIQVLNHLDPLHLDIPVFPVFLVGIAGDAKDFVLPVFAFAEFVDEVVDLIYEVGFLV